MKIKQLFPFLLLLIACFFWSCENEPVDADDSPSITCQAPESFSVSPIINNNSVRIDWDKTSGTGAWEIQYGVRGFRLGTGTTVNFNNDSSIVNGLVGSVTYDFYIRTRCSEGYYSVWVGPLSPGSGVSTCANPTNVTAVRSSIDPTIATVACTLAADGNSWQVQFGPAGFTLGSGAVLSSSLPTRIISGLIPTASYDVYVRSNCSDSQNSNWVGPISIPATGASGDDSFFALIDGTEFVDVGPIDVNPDSLLYSQPSIYIIATDAQNNAIEINISDAAVVGTEYTNNNLPTDMFRFVFFQPLPTELDIDTDGTLTVTERTATRIKGVFSFNAFNSASETVEVTSGTFDVAIP